MHIQRTHKNGYLDTAVCKIFIRLHFFYHHYFTISRRHDGIFLYSMCSFGNTKKRNHEQQQTQRNNGNQDADQRKGGAEKIKGKQINNTKQDGADCNRFVSFFMNGH